jgi:hypothetical protein
VNFPFLLGIELLTFPPPPPRLTAVQGIVNPITSKLYSQSGSGDSSQEPLRSHDEL